MGWDFDCAVIGGGPGGLVSALYLRRFERNVVLINDGKPRAAWIPRTHNLLGFPRGVSGKRLLMNLNRQIAELGVSRILGEASVVRHRGGFEVRLGSDCIRARKIILATGIVDIQPEIDNVPQLRNLGLLRYCPVCDAYDYRQSSLAVLIGSESGFQKALWLRHFTEKIDLIVPPNVRVTKIRHTQFRKLGMRIHQGRILSIDPVRKRDRLVGIETRLDHGRPLFSHAGYVMMGCTVKDTAWGDLKELNRTVDGFLTTTTEQRTSIPGLFAVGDCVNLLGQISVAAGQAAVAATTIHNELL